MEQKIARKRREKKMSISEASKQIAEKTDKEKAAKKAAKSTTKKVVTLEIDFAALEQYICANADPKHPSENKIYSRVFKPYKNKYGMTTSGRDQWLWDAIKSVLGKQPERFVKKVTREDVV